MQPKKVKQPILRPLLIQAGTLGAIGLIFAWIIRNTQENLAKRDISSGFDFMQKQAGFGISETPPLPFFGPAEALAGVVFFALAVWLGRPWERLQTTSESPTQKRIRFYRSLGILIATPCATLLAGRMALPSNFGFASFTSESSYWLAFFTGAANTLKVAVLAIVASTVLGILIGTLRTSDVPLFQRMGRGYVDTIRNIPLLLQLVFWYAIVLNVFPEVRDGLNWNNQFFVNNRGIFAPNPVFHPSFFWVVLGFVAGILSAAIIGFEKKLWQERTGERLPTGPFQVGIVLGLPILIAIIIGDTLSFNSPELVFGGRNLRGGFSLSPEFSALFLGLTIYTSAFIAEITRAGIGAVAAGQSEAGYALGLSAPQRFFLVILPQALRAMIPPLSSQYLNLTKNSSLAIAIGYPDIVSIGGIIINQDGQALEVILLWMAFYLTISLSIVLVMNIYNHRVRLVER